MTPGDEFGDALAAFERGILDVFLAVFEHFHVDDQVPAFFAVLAHRLLEAELAFHHVGGYAAVDQFDLARFALECGVEFAPQDV